MSYRIALAFSRLSQKSDYLEKIAYNTITNLGQSKKNSVIDQFVFIDAGSPEPFYSRLREKVRTADGVYRREKFVDVGVHQRQLFSWAFDNGADVAYYMEGDSKPDLALPQNMNLWQDVYIKDPTVDINIPGRSEKTWSTVPVEQRVSETHGISVPLDFIVRFYGYRGEMLDFGWGPKATKRRALHFFTDTYTKIENDKEVKITDWGHPFVALVHAANGRMKFGGVRIDTVHPVERKIQEQGNYEAEQKRLRNVLQITPVCLAQWYELERKNLHTLMR